MRFLAIALSIVFVAGCSKSKTTKSEDLVPNPKFELPSTKPLNSDQTEETFAVISDYSRANSAMDSLRNNKSEDEMGKLVNSTCRYYQYGEQSDDETRTRQEERADDMPGQSCVMKFVSLQETIATPVGRTGANLNGTQNIEFAAKDSRLGLLLNVEQYKLGGAMVGKVNINEQAGSANVVVSADLPGSMMVDGHGELSLLNKVFADITVDLESGAMKQMHLRAAAGYQFAWGWSILVVEQKIDGDKIVLNRCELNGVDMTATLCQQVGGIGRVQSVIEPALTTLRASINK